MTHDQPTHDETTPTPAWPLAPPLKIVGAGKVVIGQEPAPSAEPPAHPDEPRITGFGIDPKTSDLRHITFACNGKNVAAWRTGTGWKAEWEPLSIDEIAAEKREQSAGIQATEVSVPPPGDAQPVARSPVDPPAAVELPTGEISRDQLLSDVQWLLSEAQRLQFATGADDPPAIVQHMDPKLMAMRRIGTGQTVGVSRRYLEAIVRDLSQLRPASDAERELSIAKAQSDQWQGLAGKLAETIASDCRDWAEFDDRLDTMGAPKGDDYSRPATIERLEWVKDQLDTALAANAKLRTSLEKIATAEHSIIDGRYVNMQDFAKAALTESTVPQ